MNHYEAHVMVTSREIISQLLSLKRHGKYYAKKANWLLLKKRFFCFPFFFFFFNSLFDDKLNTRSLLSYTQSWVCLLKAQMSWLKKKMIKNKRYRSLKSCLFVCLFVFSRYRSESWPWGFLCKKKKKKKKKKDILTPKYYLNPTTNTSLDHSNPYVGGV